MAAVKITVIRSFTKEEIFGDDVPDELAVFETPCKVHTPGQEYVLERPDCPDGFCSWAFRDIYRDLIHLARGGDYPWIGASGTSYSSCTDGRKTVVFKLERI
ncbi:unnamed protein product [marine sediment metagenome]|uniref:TIGR04076 family protein n=1 Tax=marine sediment metagenome TaxID=412755 RepID=X0WWT3_9ZZZZ